MTCNDSPLPCGKGTTGGIRSAGNLCMQRLLVLLAIFGPSVVIAVSIWAVRSTRAAAREAEERILPSYIVVTPGTPVHILLVGGLSQESKPGESVEALVSDPVITGNQIAIPVDTRATAQITTIQDTQRGEA